MPIVTLLLLTAVAINSHQALSDAPIRTEFCTLTQSPGDFNGKTVVVRARLAKLKNGEWVLDSYCVEPVVLAFPANVVPKPDYELVVTPAFELMLVIPRR